MRNRRGNEWAVLLTLGLGFFMTLHAAIVVPILALLAGAALSLALSRAPARSLARSAGKPVGNPPRTGIDSDTDLFRIDSATEPRS
jgi:hypothetical protein